MTRQFIHVSEAFYADSALRAERLHDSINITVSDDDEGPDCDYSIDWIHIGTSSPVPELRVFSDSWSALARSRDLLDWLDEQNDAEPTPLEMVAALVRMGFENATPTR